MSVSVMDRTANPDTRQTCDQVCFYPEPKEAQHLSIHPFRILLFNLPNPHYPLDTAKAHKTSAQEVFFFVCLCVWYGVK